jgi:hypothetical protein
VTTLTDLRETVFASGDNLHARVVPYFLGENQLFVHGGELKADLRGLDQHDSALPDDVKAGLMSFAMDPPLKETS